MQAPSRPLLVVRVCNPALIDSRGGDEKKFGFWSSERGTREQKLWNPNRSPPRVQVSELRALLLCHTLITQ